MDTAVGGIAHKDLALITPTEGITINRTKNKISPFVPIIKTPTFAQNSGNHTGYSIEIADPLADNGYHTVCDYVSKSYLLIPNKDFYEVGVRICEESGHPYKVSRIYWDGGCFAAIFDFLNPLAMDEDEEIGLSLVMRSSYNKRWAAEAALMGKRFVCDNGVLSGEFFSHVRFKHVGDEGSWEHLIEQGVGTLAGADVALEQLVDALRAAKARRTTERDLQTIFTDLNLGPLNTGKVLERYWTKEEPTLFGLLNGATHVFWHDKAFTTSHFDLNRAVVDGILNYSLN